MQSLKSYSWFITAILAVLVFISGLTINDISFLPPKYQELALGVIGACALIVKLVPENMRVERAEQIVHKEYQQPKEDLEDINE